MGLQQGTHPRSEQRLINDRHMLGHPEIDADYFAIADCWLQATQAEPIALPLHVARLRKLMRTHFNREAKLIEAAGTRFCECHRREHDAMLRLCDDAYALSARNWRTSKRLLRGLRKLIRNHINLMDQISVLVIKAAEQTRYGIPSRSQ